MMPRLNRKSGVQLIVALMLAAGLKLYFSAASVYELRWVLAPTAYLSEWITGTRFEYEPYAGYMSYDRRIIIAAACSGVNFLIIAFLVLVVGKLWRNRSQAVGWWLIPIAAAASYVTAIVANTARISIWIWLRPLMSDIRWLSPEEVHRLEGILVYFGFLLMLFVVSERMDDSGADPARRSGIVRRSFLPLLIYYAATLGIPLANGAYREPGFWEHSLFVLLTPLLLILPLSALPYFLDNSSRKKI